MSFEQDPKEQANISGSDLAIGAARGWTLNGVQAVREATEADIAWVKAMGGRVPKLPEREGD